jgi:hypothetical protein
LSSIQVSVTTQSKNVLTSDELSHLSTEELKQEIIELTKSRDTEPISQKVLFAKNELAPIFEELSRRNPYPNPEDQVSVVLGVWTPIWSSIPYQDLLPGRLREQSYQIFSNNGYYTNMARYVPGSRLTFLQKLSSILLGYDLMVLQKFEVREGQWHIQNIAVKQALRMGVTPLTIEKAQEWFSEVVNSKLKASSQKNQAPKAELLPNLDKSTAKRLETTLLTIPQFEHLYVERDFRLVKTRREAKQRPSYTVAVRLQ